MQTKMNVYITIPAGIRSRELYERLQPFKANVTDMGDKVYVYMTIDIREENGGYVASFDGRLDTPAAIKAQQDMAPLMENADKIITLDCTKLEYISSSGLRLFLSLRKETAAKGGKVIIENINDEIKKVFMMTGFFNLFEIK